MAVLCRLSYASETLDSTAPFGAGGHDRRRRRVPVTACATRSAASARDAAASGPPRPVVPPGGAACTPFSVVGVADVVGCAVAPGAAALAVGDAVGDATPEVADGAAPDPLDAMVTCFDVDEAGPTQGSGCVVQRGSPPGLFRKACST